MPAMTVTLSAEAHRRLLDLATREKRRAYAQAAWLLERALLPEVPAESATLERVERRPRR